MSYVTEKNIRKSLVSRLNIDAYIYNIQECDCYATAFYSKPVDLKKSINLIIYNYRLGTKNY